MSSLSIAIIILLIIKLYNFFITDSKQKEYSFESQMEVFKNLGFKFNKGTSQKDILNMWGREEIEKEPFSLLYISLGAQIEREPWTPITNQAWHFDTEAISDHGDYKNILENIKRISSGELNFQKISDSVDIEKEKAAVSFELNGDKYTWDLKVEDDWVDVALFSKIVELTIMYKTKGKLTYYNTGGQDLVLGWASEEKFEKIKKETGLNIVWLR